MEGPLLRVHISSRFVNKHCRNRQVLFLIGQFKKKIFSSETAWPNKPKFGRGICGKSSMKIAHIMPICLQT